MEAVILTDGVEVARAEAVADLAQLIGVDFQQLFHQKVAWQPLPL